MSDRIIQSNQMDIDKRSRGDLERRPDTLHHCDRAERLDRDCVGLAGDTIGLTSRVCNDIGRRRHLSPPFVDSRHHSDRVRCRMPVALWNDQGKRPFILLKISHFQIELFIVPKNSLKIKIYNMNGDSRSSRRQKSSKFISGEVLKCIKYFILVSLEFRLSKLKSFTTGLSQ